MSRSIIELMQVPPELTLEFLATFARFEYALKKADYTKGDENGVQPNWNRFGRELGTQNEDAFAPVFREAEYLQQHPPMKQVLTRGGLGWARLNTEPTKIEALLFDVRTVRNNLFHGGKFHGQPVDEPSRNEQLIKSCLAVLDALLAVPSLSHIAQHFTPDA